MTTQTMICIGDSLTEGADVPVGHRWPSLVANGLAIDVRNRGIGGDTTAGMLSRFYPAVVDAKPSTVFIMGGTNDLWWGWEPQLVLGNLFSMVVQARHHGIAVVLAVPPPVHVTAAKANDFAPPHGGYDAFVKAMASLVDGLIRHAGESEVALADLHTPFLSTAAAVRGELFLPDGLHPNADGQLAIARTVRTCLQTAFGFPAD